MTRKEKLIEEFKCEQTLSNLQILKNEGLSIKKITGGEWRTIKVFKLPFDNVIPLYTIKNNTMEVEGIGVY